MGQANDIFENGAIWVRSDFHLHTRADVEFHYLGDPNFFAAQYIEKLVEQEIKLAVITNHNKFDCTEFKELRKNAFKKDIYLLPGIEFSVKDGAKGLHILIVFDNTWIDNEENHNYIQDFITSAFAGINGFDRPEYKNSNFTFNEACTNLDKFGREYFMVMAHVDDSSGLFSELQGRGLEDFLNADCFNRIIGFQKVKNRDILKKVEKVLKGRLPCMVEGTDSAHKGIDGIGVGNEVDGITQKAFVKIGAFSFEALKFALIDHKNRVVFQNKPKISNAYIKSISFAGGLLDQKKVSFSPELNSLIGIRGSGKSSILEILRYSLNIPLGNQAIDRDYKNSLIEHGIKSGGKIIIILINEHGEEYRIERIYGQKEDIYQNNILKTGININAIFKTPVYFGQKDLSNKDIDFESHLIHTLIGTRLLPIQQRIQQKKGEIEQSVSEMQKLRNLQDVRKETEATIANATHQLELFKRNGVEDKLKQQTHFDRDISVMNSTTNRIVLYLNAINEIIGNYTHFYHQSLSGSEFNKELFNEAQQLILELKQEFDHLRSLHSKSFAIYEKLRAVYLKLNSKKDSLKEEFAKIKREINLPNLNPDHFLTLNRQIETAQLKLNEISKSEARKTELQNQLSNKLVEFNSLLLEEFNLVRQEVDRINAAENKLEIEVEFKGRRDKFLSKLQGIFKGTNIRSFSYEQIAAKYPDFIEIFRNSEPLKEFLNENQIADFKRRFIEYQSDLLIYQTENKFTIKYNGKALKDHSLGQRASALILFLLAQQENDVLIIDQPEDDLDNQTIYEEVIKELKRLKGKMQFIFATHNANIPVLGDSEMVIACKYIDDKKIEIHAGTIDERIIQGKIVSIMEGGKEAFSRRKDIYDIWKIKN